MWSWNLKKGENMESFQGSTVSSQWLWLHLDTYGQVEEQHSKSSQEKGRTVSLDIMHSGCFTHKVWDTNTHTHQNTSCIHEVQPGTRFLFQLQLLSARRFSISVHGVPLIHWLWGEPAIPYAAGREGYSTNKNGCGEARTVRSEKNNTSCPHFMLGTLKHNWAAAAIYKLFYGQK